MTMHHQRIMFGAALAALMTTTGLRAVDPLSDARHPADAGRQAEPDGAGAEDAGRQTGLVGPLADAGHLHRRHREGPQGARSVPAVGRGVVQAPAGQPEHRRSDGMVRRGRRAALDRRAVSVQDSARDDRHGRHPLRGRAFVSADLHRRPPVSKGSESAVVRLLSRTLGRRHARRPIRGLQRQRVAGQLRPSRDRKHEGDRALPAEGFRAHGACRSPSTIRRRTRNRGT